MRLAGVLARSAVMMSFSRRIGAEPSINKRVRCSLLVTTVSPIRIRSPGFSSTLSAMTSPPSFPSAESTARNVRKENGGAQAPPSRLDLACRGLTEEAEHCLVGLSRQRQRCRRQRLAGLQGEQVGAFLVGIGEDEVVRTGLQGVDHRLREV